MGASELHRQIAEKATRLIMRACMGAPLAQ